MLQRIDISESKEIATEIINGQTCITITERIIVDRFNFAQRFRIVLKLHGLTIYELAKRLGTSLENLSKRIKTGKFTFEEQREIADALECNLVIKNVFDDGAEIIGYSKKQLITDSCAHAKLTVSNLAEAMKVSRQALFGKLERGRFTDAEMDEMASKIGCRYYNYFELEDGIKI